MAIIFPHEYFGELISKRIARPEGQLSGHNSGEQFTNRVLSFLKSKNEGKIFKQFEYMNMLMEKELIDEDKINDFVESSFGSFLVSKPTLDRWTIDNPFYERQNDTADILYILKEKRTVLDVKTKNLTSGGQPPNIISSYKVAKMCKNLINKKDFNFDINYIGIDWILENEHLIIKNVDVIDFFKITPSALYINWAAALQIQFHLSNIDQSFEGDKNEWAIEFLSVFVKSAENRIKVQQEKFINPFLDLIKN